MDVELVLFLREESGKIGFAPLTSMYLFGDAGGRRFDDFREAVHDSDGLQMTSGAGERLWRPISNPQTLKVSAFPDLNPRGFGLVQRNRRLEDYEDLQAHYERRPSLWVEPIGDWGAGFVQLVEIPAQTEFNDNVVAFWRPSDPLAKGGPYTITYRLLWCALPPDDGAVARVTSTRSGLVADSEHRRLFVIDFTPLAAGTEGVEVKASASTGEIANIVGRGTAPREGYRASFEFEPRDADLAELRLRLEVNGQPVSETWLFQWKR
jgi:glucans biosynthesis protein